MDKQGPEVGPKQSSSALVREYANADAVFVTKISVRWQSDRVDVHCLIDGRL